MSIIGLFHNKKYYCKLQSEHVNASVMYVCVFMSESSEKDLPGYHHLQVLHSLENIATTVTTIATMIYLEY